MIQNNPVSKIDTYKNNISFKEIEFNKLKYNILGQKTRDDAINILNRYKITQLNYNLSMSYINGKKYDLAFDNETMIKYMKDLNILKYKEDVYEEINNLLILKSTIDIAQIKTFIRIANSKQTRPQYISMKELKQRNTEQVITKLCPHCGHKCTTSRDMKHIICGYHESGYDWEGCGGDWCFTCGKMLCKKWDKNELYLLINRFHDSKCCNKHAKKNNYTYPDKYCMCKNIYVNRDKVGITF